LNTLGTVYSVSVPLAVGRLWDELRQRQLWRKLTLNILEQLGGRISHFNNTARNILILHLLATGEQLNDGFNVLHFSSYQR
jgi:hypothetical protein